MNALQLYVLSVLTGATLVRSVFGFGEALVAVPLLALQIPVTVAAPLAVLVSVLVAAVVVAADFRHVQVRSALALVGSALLGMPLGVLLLTRADEHTVKLTLGFVIIGFSVAALTAGPRLHLTRDHPAWLLGAGFVSGVLGGAYGMNGPPLAMYGSLRRWPPQHFRATLQGYFLPASLMVMGGYWAAGLWAPPVKGYFLVSLPGVLLAILAGRWLNRRMDGRRFLKYVYLVLIATGLGLLAR